MKIVKLTKLSETLSITGLAGNLKNGSIVGRNGAKISVNASDYERFNLSESC